MKKKTILLLLIQQRFVPVKLQMTLIRKIMKRIMMDREILDLETMLRFLIQRKIALDQMIILRNLIQRDLTLSPCLFIILQRM